MKTVGMVLVLLGLAGFTLGIFISFASAGVSSDQGTPPPGGDVGGTRNLVYSLPFILGGILGVAGVAMISLAKRRKRDI